MCTVYTPIGDEGCLEGEPAVYTLVQCTLLLVMRDILEGEPAVYTLVQCTLLLVMRDVWKVSLLCTHLYSVHPY